MEKFTLTFYPDKKSIQVQKDQTVLSAALSCGIYIASACAGDGVCGKCKVKLLKGELDVVSGGSLSAEDKKNHIYLACLSMIKSDVDIEIPNSSRQDFNLSKEELSGRLQKMYADSQELSLPGLSSTLDFALLPLTFKINLTLDEPSLEDQSSDVERIIQAIQTQTGLSPVRITLPVLRQLPQLLRDAQWRICATCGRRDEGIEVIDICSQEGDHHNFGLCFDIGTTTISVQLVDMCENKVLGTKATYNRQASFGSDVISRIMVAKDKDGLEKLHRAVVDTMNEMTRGLSEEHSVSLNNVTAVVCAGNTTMMHLLLGIDPGFIRKDPYIPAANAFSVFRAVEVGIIVHPRALMYCVPGVASYVGADTTAGVLATGIYKREELSILIDIGTNGEIAVGNSDFLVAAAASAGPAFEGSGVSCGMRASSGAIQKVSIDSRTKDVSCSTISNAKPRGICGSGYIDLLSNMLASGIIDKGGHIILDNNPRVRNGENGKEFVLVFSGQSDSGSDIVITEADIDNLKRAKAAIYSATEILLLHLELSFDDVKKIFIAGGFGNVLDIESSIAIGLLPDISREKFEFVGNSSLNGTRTIAMSVDARFVAQTIASKMTYMELSVDSRYMDAYMAALFFPHTDADKFPSVRFKKY